MSPAAQQLCLGRCGGAIAVEDLIDMRHGDADEACGRPVGVGPPIAGFAFLVSRWHQWGTIITGTSLEYLLFWTFATKNSTEVDFSDRTDALAEKLGMRLDELPDVLGFSRASLFNYRSGKTEPSIKALRKLRQAELNAGLVGNYNNGGTMLSYSTSSDRPPRVCERSRDADDLEERVSDLESQVSEIQKLLIRLVNRTDEEP